MGLIWRAVGAYNSMGRDAARDANSMAQQRRRKREQQLREQERIKKLQAKELKARQDKIHKDNATISNAFSKLQQIKEEMLYSLKELEVSGKISTAQYDNLRRRESKLTVGLFLFGGSPGVRLAKQYLFGKIDDDQFIKLKDTLLELANKEQAEIQAQVEDLMNEANKSGTSIHFEGHKGKYYVVDPVILKPEGNTEIRMGINPDYILNGRSIN